MVGKILNVLEIELSDFAFAAPAVLNGRCDQTLIDQRGRCAEGGFEHIERRRMKG